jgi:hypothetical protein
MYLRRRKESLLLQAVLDLEVFIVVLTAVHTSIG